MTVFVQHYYASNARQVVEIKVDLLCYCDYCKSRYSVTHQLNCQTVNQIHDICEFPLVCLSEGKANISVCTIESMLLTYTQYFISNFLHATLLQCVLFMTAQDGMSNQKICLSKLQIRTSGLNYCFMSQFSFLTRLDNK